MRTLIVVAAITAVFVLPPAATGVVRANGMDEKPIVVTTLAGMAEAGTRDGPAQTAQFEAPMGVGVAKDGTVYVSDSVADTIRTIDPAGEVHTIAGAPMHGGFKDGPAAEALFDHPQGIAVGPDGAVYVADMANRAIRKLFHGAVSTVSGHRTGKAADGTVDTAVFAQPVAVAVDPLTGDLYVADLKVGVRKIAANGIVTTLSTIPSSTNATGVACTGRYLYVAAPNGLSTLDMPSGSYARTVGVESYMMGGGHLGYPHAIATFSDYDVAFTDVREDTVRYVESLEASRVIAGAADWDPTMFAGGFSDGDGRVARFNTPAALAFRPDGSLVVADAGNHRVRTISAWDRRAYVTATGVNLDRYLPGPEDDGIVWIGASQAWSDSTWYQSIQGTLQRELEASPYYQGKGRHPRLIPMSFPGADAPAYVSAIQSYFGGGNINVKILILHLTYGGYTYRTTPAELTASIRQIAATLKARHTMFLVICQPLGFSEFPTENLAMLSPVGATPAAQSSPGPSVAHRAFVALVKSTGVAMYDAFPDFQRAERAGEGPLFGTIDPHLNDRGRALLAKLAYKALVEFYYSKR